MANRTVKDAVTVKGTNPQYLIEKIIRTRIYDSRYWKEECFALSAELLVDKAMELRFVGGVYGGNIKPAPFLCLILKMLQIQPEKDIVVEFIKNEDFKYVRALGAYYMRLTGSSMDCFKYLEPLLNDYRKLRRQNRQGGFEMVHMDEYIDELLREERMLDIILPRIQKRHVLEEAEQLEPRISALEEDLEDMESEDEDEGEIRDVRTSPVRTERGAYRDWDRPRRSPSPRFRRSPPRMERTRRSPPRRRSRSRERQREHRHRNRSRERRHRSTSRERRSARDDERRKAKKARREKEKARGGGEDLDREIQEANELRAKLGMAPLR